MADKKIEKFGSIRLKSDKKAAKKYLRIPLAVIIIIAILIVAFNIAGDILTSNISDAIKLIPYGFSQGSGYPYSFEQSTFKKAVTVSEQMGVLTEDSYSLLNRTANPTAKFKVSLNDPKVCSSNGRSVVYSNLSNVIYTYSKTKQINKSECAGVVTSADISSHGAVAACCRGEDSRSVIDVFNCKGKLEFEWKCYDEYITSASLSPFGKYVAVCLIGAENVDVYSRILMFKTDDTTARLDLKLKDTTALKIVSLKFNKILVICNNKSLIIDKDGNILQEFDYSGESPEKIFVDDSHNSLICYGILGGTGYRTIVISPYAQVKSDFNIDFKPSSCYNSKNKIVFSAGSLFRVYRNDGVMINTTETDNIIDSVYILADRVYTVANGSVFKFKY
ncbi:MAG: DUF5711 family protein [Clostridiales bacterium]|nr:DUF5711 family protein [Clostridiales bacterium]